MPPFVYVLVFYCHFCYCYYAFLKKLSLSPTYLFCGSQTVLVPLAVGKMLKVLLSILGLLIAVGALADFIDDCFYCCNNNENDTDEEGEVATVL